MAAFTQKTASLFSASPLNCDKGHFCTVHNLLPNPRDCVSPRRCVNTKSRHRDECL
ncbi:hypothetical protein K493DRAFT_315632 [Basidiobolus meristosporus CBS 931.73]|uniref:Uncharacterized protein n=1 Tax=Basidiobolus meristosporus CBS 931.73 TaxID=1314790 RepID=A0A1Y1Y870_9FUNG|nr:hypothetical protein K493DRAFT_315632 [Basidiobolus meristosporus CBS 931.73]|eukprot:ORX94168.1 hypothetical protein K493DRAFT_315632 [Basidiobolus meristosporus CBS 931.73]